MSEIKNPISLKELEQLLSEEATATTTFSNYFEYVETGPFSGEFRLKEGIKVTKKEKLKNSDFEGFAITSGLAEAMNIANSDARKEREETYQKVKNDPNRIRVVSEGDSWFQYPRFRKLGFTIKKGVKETIDHLIDSNHYAIKSLDAGGDVLRNMYHSREYIKAIREEKPTFFLLSAGGNDFFEIFPKMLQKNTSPGKISGWLKANFKTEMKVLAYYYRALLTELREEFPDLHTLIHGYDYLIPRSDGTWIGKPMIDIGMSDWEERAALIKYIMDHFNEIMAKLVEEDTFKGFVHYVNVRGTVAQSIDAWHDEIHPNSRSFEDVAEKFMAKMMELK